MFLRESVFERSGFPVRVKKTRLAKNEGFGVTRRTPRHFRGGHFDYTGVIPGCIEDANPDSPGARALASLPSVMPPAMPTPST
jgi:hypothetical protein